MNEIIGLAVATVMFTTGGMFGTTTTGQTFSQVEVLDVPRIEVFKLDGKVLWYVCEGGVMEDLRDLSICLSDKDIHNESVAL